MKQTLNKKIFSLQWHITNKCGKDCPICYIPPEERNKQQMSLEKCQTVIDDFFSLVDRWNVHGNLIITGGDPLLRSDLEEILNYGNENGLGLHILGNPESLNDENLKMLVKNNVRSYQISIDGLMEIHEKIRGKGSFDVALDSIGKLNKVNIRSVVMATITSENFREMPELVNICVENGLKRFDFSRLVPYGKGTSMKDKFLEPQVYRKFLSVMYDTYTKLIKSGVHPSTFGTKDPLWSLFFYEIGRKGLRDDGKINDGCGIGDTGLCLDVDGTVYACRRMPIGIGNVKKDSLVDLFIGSKQIKEFRSIIKIEGCNDCELLYDCRGCRAIAWAYSGGNYFAKDPQCWK